ncbi:MAG: hypothetical protein CMJ78_21565, partial [Planctomycetaceae bacterium]|nr:hypothetical protein [Planctomycetaceae bacterium]
KPAADDANDKDADKDNEDAEEADDDALKTGRFTVEETEDQLGHWAYVPEEYNADYRYALMVWLHPNADTMEATVFKEWKTHCDQRGIILLAPKKAKVAGWVPNDAESVKQLIDQFIDKYSIDESRVVAHGYSSGGPFTSLLTFKYRELIRGLSLVGSLIAQRPPENRPDFRLQIQLVCGDQDPRYALVQRTGAALKSAKFPVTVTTINGQAHAYPPSERVAEIARWIDILDRL